MCSGDVACVVRVLDSWHQIASYTQCVAFCVSFCNEVDATPNMTIDDLRSQANPGDKPG
jgi:hypothetical protein